MKEKKTENLCSGGGRGGLDVESDVVVIELVRSEEGVFFILVFRIQES